MGVLSNTAKSGISRLNKRPDLPEWWRAMQILVIIIVCLYLAVSLISGKLSNKTSVRSSGGYVSITTANSGTTTPDGAGTQGTNSTSVPLSTDPTQSVSVPSAGLSMATLAAKAIFTGDTTGLLLTTGTSFTPPSTTSSNVKLLPMAVLSQSPTSITFAASVDLSDGVGARTFAVNVIKQGSVWVFSPNG